MSIINFDLGSVPIMILEWTLMYNISADEDGDLVLAFQGDPENPDYQPVDAISCRKLSYGSPE